MSYDYACENCGAIQTRHIVPPLKCNHCNRWMIVPADLTYLRKPESSPIPDPRDCPFCESTKIEILRYTPAGNPETVICGDCLAEYPAQDVYSDKTKPTKRKASL